MSWQHLHTGKTLQQRLAELQGHLAELNTPLSGLEPGTYSSCLSKAVYQSKPSVIHSSQSEFHSEYLIFLEHGEASEWESARLSLPGMHLTISDLWVWDWIILNSREKAESLPVYYFLSPASSQSIGQPPEEKT
ncbi:hypothetical protein Q0F98_32895 [Paenibacillus amylolyticus]|nr:hypothetical protein Q0F98_32895 [Paenibacillus amylolyticus]